jgi:hypothetical protein
MHERLPSGKYNLTHFEFSESRYVLFKFGQRDLLLVMIGLPYIAHHASTIAAAMRHHHNNWQSMNFISRER